MLFNMSVKQILINWLKGTNHVPFASHNIEIDVPKYGEMMYGKLHSPGTYSRAFRSLKEKKLELLEYGLKIERIEKPDSNEDWWKTNLAY